MLGQIFKQPFRITMNQNTDPHNAGVSSGEIYRSSVGGILFVVALLVLFLIFYFQFVYTQAAMILFSIVAIIIVIQLPFAKVLFPFMVFVC